MQMSLVTDSPVHSSSSDDFAAFLDASLDSGSSEEAEDSDQLETQRVKRRKVDKMENTEELQDPTSLAPSLEQTAAKYWERQHQTNLSEEASMKKDVCTHPGSFGEMCILCGQRLDADSGVTFGYIHKGLRLENDEIVRLRNTDMKNLLRHKKLYLVLDLDHTLLNSTQLIHMSPQEEYLKSQTDSLQDVSKGSLFMLSFMHMMTKLRPFVRAFLKEASELFEMYIYTMGDRAYALEMAKLLDPQREYFSSRVISRDDGTHRHQKGLDVVLGQESAVLILDDKAWTKHKDNLILMERYHFFASSCHQFGFNCKSLSELKNDESETDGALVTILKVLRRVHGMFFDELEGNLVDRDVRQVLKTIRKEVLKGCKLVFSRVFPTGFQADNHLLWKMAEGLGASCLKELDPSVTHVVSTDAGTEKSRWAVKHKKFLVHPQWIEAANYLWQKQPEENFIVNQTKNP
ncbi:RNA polymerase II C-terminal domain phosphatase-like 4 isoform X3 [Juglans microcarpa x Juglans regia]|uniref:RNA polymerase II C-terminal domain phosphatase-like 4 isoform X3 n=1 Tax=Juglans microcarpa x Juglans regia TaxID=2249226 RepID=UPI001B7E6084|nr:RNA polymerase II C-terminal domain phosphatase-like 4 isoform X3 [Juglans microcarpa x Juglans regia]